MFIFLYYYSLLLHIISGKEIISMDLLHCFILIAIISLIMYFYLYYQYNKKIAMIQLWTDHVVYTRLYMISAIEGKPDAAALLQRLMQNQTDIGDMFSKYGKDHSNKITDLLKEHIKIAGDIVTAATKSADLTDLKNKWDVNAQQISAAFNEMDPNRYPYTGTYRMMSDHLRLTTSELVSRLSGNWTSDVASFDVVLNSASEMGRYFS